MRNLYEAMRRGKREANRTGKPLAILNLNAHSPLYVIRDWCDGIACAHSFVARVVPDSCDMLRMADTNESVSVRVLSDGTLAI